MLLLAKNMKTAMYWLQKAADNGNEKAQSELQDAKRQSQRQSIIDAIGADTFYKLEDGSFYIGMNWNSFLKYARNVSTLSSKWSRVSAEPNQWLTNEWMRRSSASDRAKYQGAVIWEVKFHQRNSVYDYNYWVIVKNGKVLEWSLV